MSTESASRELLLTPADNVRLVELCGPLDEHLRLIESRLGVEIRRRGNRFQLHGLAPALDQAESLLRGLYARGEQEPVDSERVHLALQEIGMDPAGTPLPDTPPPADELKVRTARGAIRARGANQLEYLNNVRTHDLTFGIGPAGTGKTYLAVACAVEALQTDKVRRIILVRPAVEAGERLGFLPGDLTQKVDPYLRPMYDALYEMMGFERVAKLMERNVIEVAPLAFMRGRSLNDSFVILDEAQNTTNEQMKMFLTRIGFGSKAVVTGDITQVDLPNSKQSGLRTVIDILRGVRGIAFSMFTSRDVVRHPLVQRIVQAYEAKAPGESRVRLSRLLLDLRIAARRPWVPARRDLQAWAEAALPRSHRRAVLSVAVVGDARSRSLNRQYRAKDRPTNVLSFAGAGVMPDGRDDLGELVICAPLVSREARAQRKTARAHWAHLTVHGVLHLLGMDHEREREAREMEALEVQILDRIGFFNPYATYV